MDFWWFMINKLRLKQAFFRAKFRDFFYGASNERTRRKKRLKLKMVGFFVQFMAINGPQRYDDKYTLFYWFFFIPMFVSRSYILLFFSLNFASVFYYSPLSPSISLPLFAPLHLAPFFVPTVIVFFSPLIRNIIYICAFCE